jgi:hypothetical protein
MADLFSKIFHKESRNSGKEFEKNIPVFLLSLLNDWRFNQPMSEIAKIILSSAGFSALFSAAIIWLFKNWVSERLKSAIEHEYAQKLETHKAQLKAQSDVEIERLKAELSQQHLRFSKTYDKMAEVIRVIYENIVEYKTYVDSYQICYPTKATEQELEIIRAKTVKLMEFIRKSRIYLQKSVRVKVDELVESIYLSHIHHQSAIGEEDIDEKAWAKSENLQNLRSKIETLLIILEDEFQHQLGLEPHQKDFLIESSVAKK